MTTAVATHWDDVYEHKPLDRVSWFEPCSSVRVGDVRALGLPLDAPVLDAGGGTSRFAAELQRAGYADLTVADVSTAALARARALVERPGEVAWVLADLRAHDFGRRFALWHDRAVFHFMVEREEREGYLRTLARSMLPGGHVLLSTFGPEGPTQCSTLPTARYDADELAAAFGGLARLAGWRLGVHTTPSGTPQQFLHAHLVVAPDPPG